MKDRRVRTAIVLDELSSGQRVSVVMLGMTLGLEVLVASLVAQPNLWSSCPGEPTPIVFWIWAIARLLAVVLVVAGAIMANAGFRNRLYLLAAWIPVAGALPVIWWWSSAASQTALNACP